MLVLVILILAILDLGTGSSDRTTPQYSSLNFVNYLNSFHSTWTAQMNFADEDKVKEYMKLLGGTFIRKKKTFYPIKTVSVPFGQKITLPEHFDARDKWPECPTIREILDQGKCGSCWAISTSQVVSDRVCIHSKGKYKTRLSTEDILSCCNDCGYGCEGGEVERAFEYVQISGLVTGGAYGDNSTCLPYSVPPCTHINRIGTRIGCDAFDPKELNPVCTKKCLNSYGKTFQEDKFYVGELYRLPNDEKEIMKEIMINGPVSVAIELGSDFSYYGSGVYQPLYKHQSTIGHAFKILGWGVENGTKYWLCADSMNTDSKLDGFFKIIRGVNVVKLEESIITALPIFPNDNFDGDARDIDGELT